MLVKSLLFACLFFGVISMILPDERRMEWLRLLLIVVLMLSAGSNFANADWDFSFQRDSMEQKTDLVPEKEAFHFAVSQTVCSVTGRLPVSVESDFRKTEDGYDVTALSVVIDWGEEKEVLNALKNTFPLGQIFVRQEESFGSDPAVGSSP